VAHLCDFASLKTWFEKGAKKAGTWLFNALLTASHFD